MFRELFKYFKSKNNPPDLSTALFVNEESSEKILCKEPLAVENRVENEIENLGLRHSSQWKIYMLCEHEGLYIVKNPFTQSGELFWSRKCLIDYTGPPNKCNLHLHNILNPSENWWEICHNDVRRREDLYRKLRWFTLGYHHDWDTKVYNESNKSKFPEELSLLGQCLSTAVGGWEIEPQAAIINYYHMDSSLSGHIDHSEAFLAAPLLSVSFGQSAIFLIGGKHLDDKATPIMLENGDVVIMSGSSRLCYHGVPRIVKIQWPFGNEDPLNKYLSETRININMRQVLCPGQASL